MSRTLMTSKKVAEYLKVDVRTLERWREAGSGPSYMKLSSGHILYNRIIVDAWLDSLAVRTNTKENTV